MGAAGSCPRRPAVASAIERWRVQQQGQAVNLAALDDWLVSEHDYAGSLRSVQRYWARPYPGPQLRARRRVKTPAGAQAQVDWAAFPGVIVGGELCDLLALHITLSHSRYEAIVWSLRKDVRARLRCHSEAFRRIGGVPACVRVDNEKTAVVRGAGAWGAIDPTYRRYARMLRFHVDACAPHQPQAKGKVERRVRAQRQDADPRGRCWGDLAELQAWSNERTERSAKRRRCPATGVSVWDSWHPERALLNALPETPPEPFDLAVTRTVGIDGLVCFEGRQYSVPFAHVVRSVEVRGCTSTVQMLADLAVIAAHPRHSPQRKVLDPKHYEGQSTPRVLAPPPLGRMGARLRQLGGAARGAALARAVCPPGGAGAMNAPRVKLDIDRTRERLPLLGCLHAAEALDGLLAEAVREALPARDFLHTLLAADLSGRDTRRIKTSLRLSILPTGPTLANFDFAFQPAVDPSRIETLATCAWVRGTETVLIQGPPGVGKTHLAVGLGIKAVEQGFSVRYFRFEELLNELPQDAGLAPSRLRRRKYLSTALPIIDELAFEPMSRHDGSLFFRLVTYRYARGAVLITTKKSVREWTELLAGDDVLASALLDRPLHKAHVLNITGRSYRLRDLEHAMGIA